MQSFSFILDNRNIVVRNEQELALIFELLFSDKESGDIFAWNTIMELDDRLLSLIKTSSGLFECLRFLSNRNRFLLLVKVGDNLANILTTSEQLGEILAGIADSHDKLRLLRTLRRRGLVTIIQTARDLQNIFEWVDGENERYVIELLGAEFLQSIVRTGSDVYQTLSHLDIENRDRIYEILWTQLLLNCIRNEEEFVSVIRTLRKEQLIEIINLLEEKRMSVFPKNMLPNGLDRLLSEEHLEVLYTYFQSYN